MRNWDTNYCTGARYANCDQSLQVPVVYGVLRFDGLVPATSARGELQLPADFSTRFGTAFANSVVARTYTIAASAISATDVVDINVLAEGVGAEAYYGVAFSVALPDGATSTAPFATALSTEVPPPSSLPLFASTEGFVYPTLCLGLHRKRPEDQVWVDAAVGPSTFCFAFFCFIRGTDALPYGRAGI